MADRFPEQAESDLTYSFDQKNGDRMIKQLLNSVIAKYRDLSVSRISARQLFQSGILRFDLTGLVVIFINLYPIFVTTALARSHYCNHVRFPNVS